MLCYATLLYLTLLHHNQLSTLFYCNTDQKYVNIAYTLLMNPRLIKIVCAFLSSHQGHTFCPMRWPLLFVLHCYIGKQRITISSNKCVICKSMQSEIQIKPPRINKLSWLFTVQLCTTTTETRRLNVDKMASKFENSRIKPSQLVWNFDFMVYPSS